MRLMVFVAGLSVLFGCGSADAIETASRVSEGQAPVGTAPEGEVLPHRRVVYSFEVSTPCATASENQHAAAAGLAMWQTFGVEVIEADALPTTAVERRDLVSVCFTDRPFWGSRVGSTSWTENGVEMMIRTDLPALGWVSSVAAHELGHVIFESADHLDDSRCGYLDAPDPCGGIMGGRFVWPEFTERDVAFAAARGLALP